jgi:quercetin dioxygenase-like cupin family protein
MMKDYHVVTNMAGQLEIPSDGVRSEILYDEADAKATLFAFARSAHFFEHTTPDSVQIHVLAGEATFTVDGDILEVSEGSLVYIPAGTPHGVRAQTPAVLLATFLKGGKQ